MTESNIERIQKIEQSFLTPLSFAKADRFLYGEGNVYKICRASEQKRRLILFNDIIVIAKISPNNKCFDPISFQLEEVQVSEAKDSDDFQNAWNINTPKKSFMVCAYSQSDKINWMGRIRQKANERREMLGISKPPETAAVWIPNSGAKTCMCCKKYEFSVIRRRHHCRKCGIVVCGPCSTNKIVIENMNQEQSMRVCLNCFKQSLMKDQRPEQTSTQHDEESEEAEATFYK